MRNDDADDDTLGTEEMAESDTEYDGNADNPEDDGDDEISAPWSTLPQEIDDEVSTIASSPTRTPTMAYIRHKDDLPVGAKSEGGGSEDEEVMSPSPLEDDDWDGTKTADYALNRDEEEVKKVGGWLLATSIALMIYTAYQMSENPDGICASLCRLVIPVIGCIIKILFIPFKFIIGGGRPSGGHYMATPDYRDPYGSRDIHISSLEMS